MTIALSAALTRLGNIIGDNLTGTTDSAGDVGGTTLVDSTLCNYEDNYFGDPERQTQWWVYVGATLRPIKSFQSSSGTITVHRAFDAQVATATAYSLHRFDRDKKIVAINQALIDCYPYFYKRVEDATTLDGKGSSDNEYEVPAAFIDFPDQIWEKETDGTDITYTEIVDYEAKELGGKYYFYADITEDDDIVLIGRTYLSQFTTDASTTELTASQSEFVMLLAASIFYRTLSGIVNATDAERYDALANRYQWMWDEKKQRNAMPITLPRKVNYGWLK